MRLSLDYVQASYVACVASGAALNIFEFSYVSIRKLSKFRAEQCHLPTQKKKRLLIHHHVEALQSSFLMLFLIMSRRG